MRVLIKAELLGPSDLVWPAEGGYPPELIPREGEFAGYLDTPEGDKVFQAWRDREPVMRGAEPWYVVGIEMTSEAA